MVYYMPLRVTVVNSEDIINEITSLLRRANCKREALIIDFENTEYISSSCIRALIVAARQSEAYGLPKVKCINVDPAVERILDVSGMYNILIIE